MSTSFTVTTILKPYYHSAFKTGSNVICDPPVENTDIDYILHIKSPEDLQQVEGLLTERSWIRGGSSPGGLSSESLLDDNGNFDSFSAFSSWKRTFSDFVAGSNTTFNLLLTLNKDYYDNFYLATCLAKKLNLLKKEDRVVLFEAITRDQWPSYSNSQIPLLVGNEQTP